MTFLQNLPERTTAEEAAALLGPLAAELGLPGDVPDVRTLRLWRTKRHLTLSGRNFTRRNLLEVLALIKLRGDGLTLQNAVSRVLALDDERLHLLLAGGLAPLVRTDSEPVITLHLLAKGILDQYRLVSKGAIVGHTDAKKTGIENTPLSLHQAIARLGRHYFQEGREDHAASVHVLLRLCTTPLKEWAPRALANLPEDSSAILVDPVYRVPSEDCGTIAQRADGTHLSDLIENHLHDELRATLKKLDDDADAAYTVIREFIGRRPMASAQELMVLNANPELSLEAVQFVQGLYQPVHAGHVKDSLVRRCAHCQGLIGEDSLCTLAGCRDDHPTRDTTPLKVDQAYVARPEVLMYWADPAREELRLFDALRTVKALAGQVQLYPHSDRCDVSIGEEVGVDVKDYRDPVRLAQRLNRGLGGLGQYPERILAIADRRWSPSYRDRLVEQFSADNKRMVKVMGVSDAITYLKKTYGKGASRARTA